MRTFIRYLVNKLDSTLWLIPGLCASFAIALSYVAEVIDRSLSAERSNWFLFGGGADGARELFSAVSQSMLTFTGLVFSITILVLQAASSQFSPRALRTFLKDRISKLALGVFIGTFVYALLGLRLVRAAAEEQEVFVPALSAWLTVPMVLLSVGTFIVYLHHTAQSIRAVVIIRRIADETRTTLERLFPEGIGDEADRDPQAEEPRGPPDCRLRNEDSSGVLVTVNQEKLLHLVEKSEVTLALRFELGDFVPIHAPLFDVWGDSSGLDAKALRRCLTLGRERTLTQDAGYGFRQLVDVAGRALSPSTNDPTTAVEVIDQLHDLLRRLVDRRFPDPNRKVGDTVRLVLPRPDWDDYLQLALEEIRDWGRDSVQVRARIRYLLEDLMEAAPEFRRGPLLRQLELLRRTS